MKIPVFFFLGLLLVAPIVAAGQQDSGGTKTKEMDSFDAPHPLEIKKRLKTALHGALIGRDACDEDGNIYVRLYVSRAVTGRSSLESPLQKIKPDGSLGELFQNTTTDGDKLGTTGIAVAPDGQVYQVGWGRDLNLFVSTFAKDGSVKARTKLATEFFHPANLAVFKSGEFLFTGSNGKDRSIPYTAVFSSDGKFVKEITEADTAEENPHSKSPAESSSGNVQSQDITFGAAVGGADGNVYFGRAVSPALIYGVSPSGEVVRKLKIDPGRSGYVMGPIRAYKGGLAVAFSLPWQAGSVLIKVVTYSGDPIATYELTERTLVNENLACYADGSLTFVTVLEDNNVYLYTAAP